MIIEKLKVLRGVCRSHIFYTTGIHRTC